MRYVLAYPYQYPVASFYVFERSGDSYSSYQFRQILDSQLMRGVHVAPPNYNTENHLICVDGRFYDTLAGKEIDSSALDGLEVESMHDIVHDCQMSYNGYKFTQYDYPFAAVLAGHKLHQVFLDKPDNEVSGDDYNAALAIRDLHMGYEFSQICIANGYVKHVNYKDVYNHWCGVDLSTGSLMYTLTEWNTRNSYYYYDTDDGNEGSMQCEDNPELVGFDGLVYGYNGMLVIGDILWRGLSPQKTYNLYSMRETSLTGYYQPVAFIDGWPHFITNQDFLVLKCAITDDEALYPDDCKDMEFYTSSCSIGLANGRLYAPAYDGYCEFEPASALSTTASSGGFEYGSEEESASGYIVADPSLYDFVTAEYSLKWYSDTVKYCCTGLHCIDCGDKKAKYFTGLEEPNKDYSGAMVDEDLNFYNMSFELRGLSTAATSPGSSSSGPKFPSMADIEKVEAPGKLLKAWNMGNFLLCAFDTQK